MKGKGVLTSRTVIGLNVSMKVPGREELKGRMVGLNVSMNLKGGGSTVEQKDGRHVVGIQQDGQHKKGGELNS